MDQTGVHLVPSASWTYEKVGSSSVAIVGADDKRQITACVAATLDGILLPLQLIFQGKTDRSLPRHSAASVAARIDLTHSDNHWSSQATMQRWVSAVLLIHTNRMIEAHQLDADAHVILVLDAWAVHKSEEFRSWISKEHPRIHLVFVPANCTSKLQVADVALQRPFKHGITQRFNEWAARTVAEQIREEKTAGLAALLTMSELKPLVLQWCSESWQDLRERRQVILDGWSKCCTSLYNVNSVLRREEAVHLVALKKLDTDVVPEETEPDGYIDSDSDTDDGNDELDVTKPFTVGQRTGRKRTQAKPHGYMLDPTCIELDEDEAAAAL